MREEKRKVISYLLNDDVDANLRLSVCTSILDKFPCDQEYELVRVIKDCLTDHEETPSLSYIRENCNYNYDTLEFDDKINNRVDALEYLKRDWEFYIEKQLSKKSNELLGQGKGNPELLINEIKDVVNQFETKLPKEERKSIMESYRERAEMGEGLKTYNKQLDDYIPELPYGVISVLAGAPGHMKTTVALDEIRNNVVFGGKNVVFLSLELDYNLVMYKFLSAQTFNNKYQGEPYYGTEVSSFIHGELSEEQEHGIEQEVLPDLRENAEGNIRIFEKSDVDSWTVSGLRSTFAKLPFEVDAVYIDHLQEFSDADVPQKYYSYEYPEDWLVQQLTSLESDVDGSNRSCHIRVLSQVTQEGRKYAEENDGEYLQHHILYSSTLSQAATLTQFIYAPQSYLNANYIKMNITKNRYGKQTEFPVQISAAPGENRVGEEGDYPDSEGGEDITKEELDELQKQRGNDFENDSGIPL